MKQINSSELRRDLKRWLDYVTQHADIEIVRGGEMFRLSSAQIRKVQGLEYGKAPPLDDLEEAEGEPVKQEESFDRCNKCGFMKMGGKCTNKSC